MNNIEILEEFIKHYKEVQEKYKDDEIHAEIERSCYFEEVPAEAIENLIQENKELKEKAKNTMGLIGANYIHKDKVKELGEQVHSKLDNNAITRGYQIIIDEMFSKILEEGE